jgi:uncharacterized metal-binding protein YceD (DUF177 family)
VFETKPEGAPAKPAEKKFEEPIEKSVPEPADGNSETTIRRREPQQLNLDGKIAWQSDLQRSRVHVPVKLAKATVTRRVPAHNADWTPVVAKSTGTQVVRK